MMNIFQIQEQLRTMPDDVLVREMQMPSGQAPQYLLLTEIQRRQQLRVGAGAQPMTSTVAQDMSQQFTNGQPPQQPMAQPQASMPPVAQSQAPQQPMQQPGYAGGGLIDKINDNPWIMGLPGFILDALVDKPTTGIESLQTPKPFAGGGGTYLPPVINEMTEEEMLQRDADHGVIFDPRQKNMVKNKSLRNKIYGPESEGGKDLNSRASHGAYIGPGQMNKGSYEDGVKFFKRTHPNAVFPAWNPKWIGSPEGNRPKDYPTNAQWDNIVDGYSGFVQHLNARAGIPTDDAHGYGAYNIGPGNLRKLVANPDEPIKNLFTKTMIAQNGFNPNADYEDMLKTWSRRMNMDFAPPTKEVQSLPSGRFYSPMEDDSMTAGLPSFARGALESEDPIEELKAKIQGMKSDKEESNRLAMIANMTSGGKLNMFAQPQQQAPSPPPAQIMQGDDPNEVAKILQSMQRTSMQNKAARDQRMGRGYAEGGIVVINGKQYRRNKDGVPVDENGMPVKNRNWYWDERMKSAEGADRFFSDMTKPPESMTPDPQHDTGWDNIGKAFYAPYQAAKNVIGGLGSFANAVVGGSSMIGRDFANSLDFNREDLDKMYSTNPRVNSPEAAKSIAADMAKRAIQKPQPPALRPTLPPDEAAAGAPGPSSLEDYVAQARRALGENPYNKKYEDLISSLTPNKERDKWMAIADFGGKLASGTSPWFAQNFGPAAQAGIGALRSDRDMYNDQTLKIAQGRLAQGQMDDVNRRGALDAGVNMYEADKSYQRAVTAAAINASRVAHLASIQNKAVDGDVVWKAIEFSLKDDPVYQSATPEIKRKMVNDAMAYFTQSTMTAGITRDSKAGGMDDSGNIPTNDSLN